MEGVCDGEAVAPMIETFSQTHVNTGHAAFATCADHSSSDVAVQNSDTVRLDRRAAVSALLLRG